MTLVMAGRPPQSSHILQTATDLNWNLPFPGGKRRVDCLSPSVYAASSLDVCGPRRGGEGTEIVDSIVGKFDRITADDGFHGREGGREEDEDISRANSLDLWRPRTVHAPMPR